MSKRLAWDDAMVVAALLLTAIPLGCVLVMAVKGFGEHLWNLGDAQLLPILRYRRSCMLQGSIGADDRQCTLPGRHTSSYYA